MQYAGGNYSSEVEQFITSVRLRALEDSAHECCSDSQARRLAIQIKKSLSNPRNRIVVLRAITGLPIRSQSELSFRYLNVLISETMEEEDAVLLREIESLIEATPDREPVDLFPWYGPMP